jgi:hypothetical protein
MAQSKKISVKAFQTLAEWKKAYIPLDIQTNTVLNEYVKEPNDLAVMLAMEAIKKIKNQVKTKISAA